MTLPLVISIIGVSLSALTSLVLFTAVIVTMKNNLKQLDLQTKAQFEREEKVADELTQLLIMVKTFMAEQTNINKTVSAALDGVMGKIDQMQIVASEMQHTTSENAAVLSLLTEVLKKGVQQVSIEP